MESIEKEYVFIHEVVETSPVCKNAQIENKKEGAWSIPHETDHFAAS